MTDKIELQELEQLEEEEDIIEGEVISLPLKDAPPFHIGDDVVEHHWDSPFWNGDGDEEEDDTSPFSETPFTSPVSGRTTTTQYQHWLGILGILLLIMMILVSALGVLFSYLAGVNPFAFSSSLVSGLLGTTSTSTTTALIQVTPEHRQVHLTPVLPISSVRGVRIVPNYSISLSGSQTASGVQHLPTTVATGMLTFFNAALVAQTVPAGTQIAAPGGIVLITHQSVVVPASLPPLEGQATIEAQTMQTGVRSNLSADVVSGQCCGMATLLVQNTAFTGGQDARTIHIIETKDITVLQQRLTTQLNQQIGRHQQQELMPQEQLDTTVSSCDRLWSSQGQPGDIQASVQLQVQTHCQDVAVIPTLFQTMVQSYLNTSQSIASYENEIAPPAVRIVQVDTIHQRLTLDIQVPLAASWNQQELESMLQVVAGLSQHNANTILSTWPGMGHASIQVSKQGTIDTSGQVLLPGDIGNITIEENGN